MQRVLFVTHNLALEGAQISQYLLAICLKKKGLDISILSPCLGPLLTTYQEADIEVKVISPSDNWIKDTIKFLYKLCWLMEKQFDLVYLNTLVTAPFLKYKKYLKVPFVWCIRESHRDLFKEYVQAKNFALADQVIFAAHATRHLYKEFDRGHFNTIHNGIDLSKIKQFCEKNSRATLRKKYGITPEAKIVLNVGALTELKGQIYFVEAANQILKKNKEQNLLFYMLGNPTDGDYPIEVNKLAKQFGFEKQIRALPATANIYDWYRMSDYYVCSSLTESFPRVILEAMAFKLPIIASNIYGIPEQIQDGLSGILIPTKSPADIVKALEFFLKNGEKTQEMAENAYNRVQEKFSLEQVEKAYFSLFSELCQRK